MRFLLFSRADMVNLIWMWPMLDVKKSDPICLHGGTSVYMSEVSQKQQQQKKNRIGLQCQCSHCHSRAKYTKWMNGWMTPAMGASVYNDGQTQRCTCVGRISVLNLSCNILLCLFTGGNITHKTQVIIMCKIALFCALIALPWFSKFHI